jgi:hypothetical protein
MAGTAAKSGGRYTPLLHFDGANGVGAHAMQEFSGRLAGVLDVTLYNTGRWRLAFYQCCGPMTFWCGSGSTDPCLWLWLMDPLFSSLTFKLPTKNALKKDFLHHLSKIKSQKEITKQ